MTLVFHLASQLAKSGDAAPFTSAMLGRSVRSRNESW